jgi:ATP-dependent DNA helicase RecQ
MMEEGKLLVFGEERKVLVNNMTEDKKKKKFEILQSAFGYSTFREGQERIIDSILEGHDTLAIMPTGAGKSICYQVPALIMEGITLVISPLVSLMKDQVRALNEAGVHAAYLNSSLTYQQYQKALALAKNYQYKIIYAAPERLMTEEFLAFALEMEISMISIDEAHCISQWGQNFRPSYLKIVEFIGRLSKRPVISAFTATATWQVKDDMQEILKLQNPTVLVTGFDRTNLYYEVRKPKDKLSETIEYVEKHQMQSGIIYCLTRKLVEEVSLELRKRGIEVTRYHAGLSDTERKENQDDFIYDRKPVMVATNAFGMGIDKPNVNYVIHYNMPKDLESYYQEAGRAGRDGEPANCILLYGGRDVITNQFFIDNNEENSELDEDMRKFIQEKDRERLRKMTFYCFTNDCLRDYILRYFNEYGEHYCGNCKNCLTKFEEVDITIPAQKILGCVDSVRQRYGINVILDTLRGSKAVRVRQYGLDRNKYYGQLSGEKDRFLRLVLNHLMLKGYILLTDEEYPILKLTQLSEDVLNGGILLTMKIPIEEPKEENNKRKKIRSKNKTGTWEEMELHVDENLFEELRELRRRLAVENKIPPYIVFNDKTLREMCHYRPKSEEEMLKISGVGAVKYKKYGVLFMEKLQSYQA